MKNLGQMLKQAQQMQARMAEMQAKLAEIEVTGTAGGGMVQVTLNGKGEVKKLKIDKSAVDPNETEVLEDLILAAFNDAKARVDRHRRRGDGEAHRRPEAAAGDEAAVLAVSHRLSAVGKADCCRRPIADSLRSCSNSTG